MSQAELRTEGDWVTSDLYKSPMDVCWQFQYDIDIDKLRNLYTKSKRLQWDAERDLDWDTPVDPSKPIIEEERFGFAMIPFIQKLSKSQRETFTAHVGASASPSSSTASRAR